MKINFKKIDHIMLCIPEGKENEARDFYSNILGLKEINNTEYAIPNGAMWFQIGNIQLHIKTENKESQSTERHPAFIIDNIDATKSYLISAGISIKNNSPIPDRKRFSFWDPFGNRIELIEML